MLISGGTGSGKTTTLNVLSNFIPPNERIVTIEDSAELQLPQEHLVRLETRPANIEGKGAYTIRDLVKNALRMRPDRLIVGEVRGAEALDMLQAMNTGHDGSLSTIHANNPNDTLMRVETMVLMAVEMPVRAIREQIVAALNIIVQIARMPNGGRRVTHITEVLGIDPEQPADHYRGHFPPADRPWRGPGQGAAAAHGIHPAVRRGTDRQRVPGSGGVHMILAAMEINWAPSLVMFLLTAAAIYLGIGPLIGYVLRQEEQFDKVLRGNLLLNVSPRAATWLSAAAMVLLGLAGFAITGSASARSSWGGWPRSCPR